MSELLPVPATPSAAELERPAGVPAVAEPVDAPPSRPTG